MSPDATIALSSPTHRAHQHCLLLHDQIRPTHRARPTRAASTPIGVLQRSNRANSTSSTCSTTSPCRSSIARAFLAAAVEHPLPHRLRHDPRAFPRHKIENFPSGTHLRMPQGHVNTWQHLCGLGWLAISSAFPSNGHGRSGENLGNFQAARCVQSTSPST